MSVKLELYNNIISKLKELDEIKTTGLYNSQYDNEPTEHPFNYPAVFVHFNSIDWQSPSLSPATSTNVGNRTQEQKGDIIITLHIGFFQLEDETDSFPLIISIIESIYRKIAMLSGEYFTPLLRTFERQDINHANVIVWELDFSTMVIESAGLTDKVDATDGGVVDIGLDLQTDLDIDNDIIRTGDGV